MGDIKGDSGLLESRVVFRGLPGVSGGTRTRASELSGQETARAGTGSGAGASVNLDCVTGSELLKPSVFLSGP